MPVIRARVTDITDIAENLVSVTSGAMEEATTFQLHLSQQAAAIVQQLNQSKSLLERAAIDSQHHDGQISAKEFSQSLDIPEQVARRVFACYQWPGFFAILLGKGGVIDTRLRQLGESSITFALPNRTEASLFHLRRTHLVDHPCMEVGQNHMSLVPACRLLL